MYVIKINGKHREYVASSSPNWLNLLNDTTSQKKYATKFQTKKEAEQFMFKLIEDGYTIAGTSCCDRFDIVRY